MRIQSTFGKAIAAAQQAFLDTGYRVHSEKWQGMDIKAKPDMEMVEVLNHDFCCAMPTLDLDYYRNEVKPNLPWADDHFLERVNGEPLNPGVQWANWPYATSADRFRKLDIFTHTYMERYWPKFAGMTMLGRLAPEIEKIDPNTGCETESPNRGYRFEYGDLRDVVELLKREPLTRQAFLPVWFPEDTGVRHGGRVPCSIGYHFMMRGGYFHVGYWLRSCDFVRHFRDDIYLTVRLAFWVLDQLRQADPGWCNVKPGFYSMWMTSLHMFINDYRVIFGKTK